jgi:hypothetical protein
LQRFPNNENFVGIFYQNAGVVADASHPVLPQIHFTSDTAVVPFYPNLLGVRNPSHHETWPV